MLFPYQYVPHKMEKMQEFIDFIFFEVWCKAPRSGPFDLTLFDANPDLKEVIMAFFYSDAAGADFFYSHIENIYRLFAPLTPPKIDQFKQWYTANNDIERVCANDPASNIARYADIIAIFPDLSAQLASFFKGLYSQQLLNLKVLRDKIGQIDDHYREFMQVNTTGKCPFCGLVDMQGVYHTKREAYDHYLPKVLYPFNSVNFKNLVPSCHHCNSSYKSSQDPAYTPKDPTGAVTRRKVFYPFAATGPDIEIRIDFGKNDVDNLTPNDIALQFGPAALREEIDTWKDVYGIEERYKNKCCGESDGKYWLQQVLDEWQVDGRKPVEFMNTLARHSQRNPYAECNFLKKAFLESCDRAGLFTILQRSF